DSLPSYLNYQVHAENNSLWNTAPTFAIYVVKLVTEWLLSEFGSLQQVYQHNLQKAKLLYDVVDAHPQFYQGHAAKEYRSLMNVTFRLPSEELTKQFVHEARNLQLAELKGHRSVGGIRASIYNAMPLKGV